MSREALRGISVVINDASGEPMLRFIVDAERAVVGSGAHCEVRLPPELVAREQLLLVAADGGGVRFQVRSRMVVTALRGVPAEQGELAPSDVLQIGSLTLTASMVSLADERRRFPLEALALVPAVVVLVIALTFAPASAAPGILPAAPALFDEAATTCPILEPSDAAHFATQRYALAVAKRERGPFSAGDSVGAVSHFREASACFRRAGEQAKANDAVASADALRRKLEDEYLTRRTRLEHAFVEGDKDGVDRELPTLVALTAHLHCPYVEWLVQENRRAELEKKKPRSTLL